MPYTTPISENAEFYLPELAFAGSTCTELLEFSDDSESFDLKLRQLHLLVITDGAVHPAVGDVLHGIGV